jgi:hypothetical protein
MKKYELEIKNKLFNEISKIIEQAKGKVAVYLNAEITLLYWNIGNYILKEIKEKYLITYGKNILATLSQELTRNYGKGFTYTSLTRMIKVAETFTEENIATLSQQLSWSHLIELSHIDDMLNRTFYTQMAVSEKWSVRNLRKQMELYLRWLEKYEMQESEGKPIGLLLCSEGNTEHIELLLLDEDKIKVAQYLTELPSKEWFIDKLHKALELINNNEEIKNESNE